MKMSVLNIIKWVVILIAVLCMPISTYADLIYTFDVDTEGWMNLNTNTEVSLTVEDGELVQRFVSQVGPVFDPDIGNHFDPYIGVFPWNLYISDYKYFVASIFVEDAPLSTFLGGLYFIKPSGGSLYGFELVNGENIILIDLEFPTSVWGDVLSQPITYFRLDLPDGYDPHPSSFYDWKDSDTIFRIDYVGLTNNPLYPDPIPEPATLTLLVLGMAGMAYRRLRKKA